MDKLSNLALLAQMLESAEKNVQSARQLLKEIMGGKAPVQKVTDKARVLAPSAATTGGRVIEGVFDGQNMIGPDGKQYPVPANYASKSKLVEGDVLKLTIADDGSFIYKQIGPVERVKKIGVLSQEDNGEYKVVADGKTYKVLLASLTYYKAEPGDEVTIVVPKDQETDWAAVENVIRSGKVSEDDDDEPSSETPDASRDDLDRDLELDLDDEEEPEIGDD